MDRCWNDSACNDGVPGSDDRRPEPMTRLQARKARHLLGWSSLRLANNCGIPESAVRSFEATGRMSPPMFRGHVFDRTTAMRATLEAAGVVFSDGVEPGVELRKMKA